MFDPTGMCIKFGVTAMDANGLNTIRGHLGGTLIAGSAMMDIGLCKKIQPGFYLLRYLCF